MPRMKHIRQRILRERGVTATREKRKMRYPQATKPYTKTWAMRTLEEKYGIPIEAILSSGTCREVGRRFGIDYSTVSKWRTRLGLNGQEVQEPEVEPEGHRQADEGHH